ncbi:MAG: hypothetical protein ABW221_22010 [Vicinamibacteria bacterium]
MRPLVKVNPTTFAPNYPYYTVPSLGALIPFGGGSSIANAFNGGAAGSMTMLALLTAMLTHKTGGYPFTAVGMTPAAQNYCIKRIRAVMAPLYRLANPHLSAQLGPYCCYCELPIPGHHLDVEHRIPKGNFPLLTTLWLNFLAACGRCDSAKGKGPSRALALLWFGGGAPNEAQLMQAVEDRHFWPDLPDVFTGQKRSFRRTRYRLRNVAGVGGGGAYAPIAMNLATAPNASLASFVNYAVRANVPLAPGAVPTAAVRVEVVCVGAPYLGAGAAAVNAQTVATINYLGLAVQNSARAGYRTYTWFRVLAAVNNLTAFYVFIMGMGQPQATVDTLFDFMWAQFLFAAQGFGHYSTIVTLLLEFNYPIGLTNLAGYATLAHRFIADSSPAAGLPMAVFPGTVVATVP